MKNAYHWLIFVLLLVALGCGGGGGGVSTPSTVSIVGQVFWIETGAPTNPNSTVRIGTVSTTTDPVDGFFSMNVPSGSNSLTVTFTPSGGSPVIRTFSFPSATSDLDLGDIYIGPAEITMTGTIVSSTDQSPVGNATVSIAGRSGITNSNGQFSIPGVAYSSTNLAVFLGLQGTVTATNYFTGFFNPPSGASGGSVNVGVIAITPTGTSTPPGLPYNVSGSVLPTATGAGATVQAKVGSSVIRFATANGAGRYELWLPAGTYTIEAVKGSQSGSAQVTVSDVSSNVTANVTLN